MKENDFFRTQKKTTKNIKHKKKRGQKKEKEGPKGFPNWIFHIRPVKRRSRNEIETHKKSDFEHPTIEKERRKKQKEKLKEIERK